MLYRPNLEIRSLALYCAAAATVCAVLLAVLYFAAARADGDTRRNEERTIAGGTSVQFRRHEAAVAPRASWDEAVRNLDNQFSREWADASFGREAQRALGVRLAIVLADDETPLFTNLDGEPLTAAEAKPFINAADTLIAAVRRAEAQRGPLLPSTTNQVISYPIQSSAAALVAGEPYMLSATLVQPSFGHVLPRGERAPIILSGQPYGTHLVRMLAERFTLQDARLAVGDEAVHPSRARHVMRDAALQPVVTLHWRPHQPGMSVFYKAAPAVCLVVLALAACLFLVLRRYQSVNSSLASSEAQLKLALEAATAAADAKSRFLATVSHEIRTPMNGILGVMHLLKAEQPVGDGALLLDEALACGEMLTGLIDDVLDFSKIEAGQLELNPAPIQPAAIVEGVVKLLRPRCDAKGISLTLAQEEDFGWVSADPLRLRQALFNLIGNAVKFTSQGGVSVRITRPSPDRLHFEVADTGVGIPEAAQASVFDPFHQGDSSTTRRFGGTGLGLTITRRLARMMDGDVGFESRAGEGSTFWLELSAPPAQAPAAASATAKALRPLRMLVVEDNATNRLVVTRLLEAMGVSVETAEDGRAGLEAARRGGFDVILMDVQMPVMDGLEATRCIRALGGAVAATPIIALTANAMTHQKQSYALVGMDGVVAKPISPASLFAEIARVTGDAGAADIAVAS